MRDPHFHKGKTMKLNRFGTFTLGVLITAISVGAVSYANATGDATIKSCANKKTGAMRYISKGACKKTEKLLSWNQIGPQGLPGAAGNVGPSGTTGAKGETGSAGSNGQNYFAVDAKGKTLGQVVGHSGVSVDVVVDGRIWSAGADEYNFQITQNGSVTAFSDASCAQPLLEIRNGVTINPQGITIDWGADYNFQSTDKAYQANGAPRSWADGDYYHWTGSGPILTCTIYSSASRILQSSYSSLYSLVEVQKPAYTAPLTIVAK
jgi:hypothetical protein